MTSPCHFEPAVGTSSQGGQTVRCRLVFSFKALREPTSPVSCGQRQADRPVSRAQDVTLQSFGRPIRIARCDRIDDGKMLSPWSV